VSGPTVALFRLASLLSEVGARWALVGGMAMIARVHIRPTDDVDVVLALPVSRAREIAERSRRHGFTFDEEEMRTFGEAGLVRLRDEQDPTTGADLIFVDSRFLDDVVNRATSVELAFGSVPVASVEDLLLLKLDANRPEDLEDAITLKDVHGAVLDRAYLKAQGAALYLTARLEAFLGPL